MLKKDFAAFVPELVALVKSKKVLSHLDDSFVERKVLEYLTKHTIILTDLRSKQTKEVVKALREELHEVYGVFWDHKRKGTSFETFLKSHTSSLERFSFYSYIYSKIFSFTGKPTTLLDLGCGLNPFSYSYLGCSPRYYGVELSTDDCEIIQEYFRKENISGDCVSLDLSLDYKKLSSYTVDVVFLFKILDFLPFEGISWIFDHVRTTYFVVSFPTKSLCGKRFATRRTWFEKYLKKFTVLCTFSISNEIFYVLKK